MESEVGVRKLSDGIVMAFEYTLSPEISKTDHILIAYSQPFTRTDVEKSIDLFESQMKQSFLSYIDYHNLISNKFSDFFFI